MRFIDRLLFDAIEAEKYQPKVIMLNEVNHIKATKNVDSKYEKLSLTA
jgi:hypothetical protein